MCYSIDMVKRVGSMFIGVFVPVLPALLAVMYTGMAGICLYNGDYALLGLTGFTAGAIWAIVWLTWRNRNSMKNRKGG